VVCIIRRFRYFAFETDSFLLLMSAGDQSRDQCCSRPCEVIDGVSVSGKAAPGGDDDVTTTTSGSYTVDTVREMCSEIDEMFFSHSDSTNV